MYREEKLRLTPHGHALVIKIPLTLSGQRGHEGVEDQGTAAKQTSVTRIGGYTHSAQPRLWRGPSCQVSAGTGTLVSWKLSLWGRGARGPPSKTSSGFLCTVSTGGRREESREDKNRHSSGPSAHVLTQTRLLKDQDMTTRCQDTHWSKGMGHSLPYSQPSRGQLPATMGPVYNIPIAEGP